MLVKCYTEFINENIKQSSDDVLDFIKQHLNIKSEINLIDKRISYNGKDLTNNAGVEYSDTGKFNIYVSFDQTKFGFVRHLAHEMIHVKQMEDGRLKLDGDIITFDGIQYSMDDYITIDHDNFPFEVEAHEQEREIANAYWNGKI